jgi:hypothetical protein
MGCPGDDDTNGGISDPVEVANQMNANLSILTPGSFTVDPSTTGTDNTITISPTSGTTPIMAGQSMTNQIGFNAPNGNVNAVGMRFGTSGPITFVPVDNTGSTNGTSAFTFLIDASICGNLSQICHDIRCYEFAQTSSGNISAANIRDVAMLCGNCDEPSCAGLVDPSDCDVDPGGGGTGGLGSGSFNFGPSGSQNGSAICDGSQLGGFVSISGSSAQLIARGVGTSGSSTFTSDPYTGGCTSCPGMQITLSNGDSYIAVSGSGSWSGNTFSFSASLKTIVDIVSGGGQSFSVSGSGTCQ